MPLKVVRTIFVSDIHLGCRNSQAAKFLRFLQTYQTKKIYINGDFLDLWQLRFRWYWNPASSDIIKFLLETDTKVTYLLGNHDEALGRFLGMKFGNVKIKRTATHKMMDGRKFLILHGDQFDRIMQEAVWAAKISDFLYEIMVSTNVRINKGLRFLHLPPWHMSRWLKFNAKYASYFLSKFEKKMIHEGEGFQGVVCGHTHHAEIRPIGELIYVNCGDWVESCTAIVEELNGSLRLVEFNEEEY
jgi:UDP-2,3-diacylglucosamine pyrophosphatase LpxH